MKTILITDAGGRGAALVDKYGQSNHVGKILVVPGNDLMQINTTKPVTTYPHLKTTSVAEIIEICKKENVDLVDVAQDNAVEAGVVDAVAKLGIDVIGPTKEAGRIEWDKAWARAFMTKYDIPAPTFYTFDSQQKGIDFVKKHKNTKWFVKASGLAEGKGVIPAQNLDETILAIKHMEKFGISGKTFLLEEWLVGEEFSAFAICDGNSFQIIGFAQDHKRVNNNDQGPNTGGMGCVSNPLIVTRDIAEQTKNIIQKTITGLQKEGHPYKGILYVGGMVVGKKVFVIEFNARWGDPEAEIILPSITNDYYEIALAVIAGTLQNIHIKTDSKTRVVVAACAKGYPVDYVNVKGKKLTGIDAVLKKGAKIYGAGVSKQGTSYIVSGGRVAYVIGDGKDVITARKNAYDTIKLLNIEGNNLHYRTDIGWRDVARLQNKKKS